MKEQPLFFRAEGLIPCHWGVMKVLNPTAIPLENTIPRYLRGVWRFVDRTICTSPGFHRLYADICVIFR